MSQDTQYVPVEYVFKSVGVVARFIQDQAPVYSYLNLDGALEREEESMSSTYGTRMITRDPDGTVGGVNYLLPNPIVALSRLVNKSNGNSWRYAADDQGLLYRRAGDTQGAYTQIAMDLSGQQFTAVTTTCYESSTPYLFIADAVRMLKDNGTGSPTQIGIVPPWQTAGYTPYAPKVLVIEPFTANAGFTVANTVITTGTMGNVVAGSQTEVINNFQHYLDIVSGGNLLFNGVLAVPLTGPSNLALIFDVYGAPSQPQFSGYGISGGSLPSGANTFELLNINGSVGAATTATISKTVNLDLSQNNQVTDDDLIVLTMMVSVPQNVQQINVLFDVNGSNYVNYFQKSIVPANYQSGISSQVPPYTALANQTYVVGLAQGKSTVALPTGNEQVVQQIGVIPSGGSAAIGSTQAQLTPVTLSTGAGAWISAYMRRGDFLPVGLAGQQNQTWAQITGWQIQIVTAPSGGPYALTWAYPGKPPGCTLLLGTTVGVRVDFPGNFGGSSGTIGTNPTNHIGFGVGTIGPYGQRNLGEVGVTSGGIFQFTTPGGQPVSIYAGETLTIFTPCPQDATASDVSIVFNGTTSTTAGTNFAFNGMYLQWGAGPSSYGGVGYDYRFTYYNFNTGTESNPSPIPQSSLQYGFTSSYNPLIVLRQAINVRGVYSPDPQVTHVQIYRRGGSYGDNWHYLDRIPNITGSGTFNYKDIIPDSAQSQQDVVVLDNDVPVTSTLQNPISTTLSAGINYGTGPNDVYYFFGPILITVTDPTSVFVPGQVVDVGNPQNLEQVTVQQGGVGQFYAVLRLQHAAGEPVQVFSVPAQPVDLVELAYGQLWWAGDPNNPHYLYYSKPEYPENVGPQNYISVSQPSDPIMAVINFRGTLFVATLTTWYQIIGGQTPYAQPTGSKHGLVAKHGWCRTESAIFYQSVDGVRLFRGADGAYLTLPVEWIYRNNAQSLIPLVDLTQLDAVQMGYWNNYVYVSYVRQ